MPYNPKTLKFSGDVQEVNYTPGGAVNAGDVIVINNIVYFSESDIAAGIKGSLVFSGGAWAGNKGAGTWTAGDRIYWNPTGNPNVGTAGTGCFQNTVPAAGYLCGIAIPSLDSSSAALTGDQYGYFVKVNGLGSDLKTVGGQATTVTASDTIVTGLEKLVGVIAGLDDSPGDNPEWVNATIGDQNAAPVAGSFYLKSWQNTGGTDPTPVAATTFGKKVNWLAFGS